MKIVFKIIFLLILFKWSVTAGIKKECKKVYDQTLGLFINGDKEYFYNLTHDIKGFNSLGNYKECMENTKKTYFLVKTQSYKVAFSIGFCVPIGCSPQEFSDMVQQQKIQFEDQLTRIFRDDQHNRSGIKIIDQKVEQQKLVLNGWFFMGMSYYIILLVLGISGSVVTCIYTKTKIDFQENEQSLNQINTCPSSNSIQYQQQHREINLLEKYEQEYKEDNLTQFLACFSIVENTKELFEVEKGRNQNLNIFNGIRILFCLNTVYIHTFRLFENQARNFNEVEAVESQYQFLLLHISAQTVDSFFMMSGFLQAFIFLVKLKQLKNYFQFFFSSIFHRILRIWPSLFTTIVAYWAILPYILDGPVWVKEALYIKESGQRLWKNLLFIDNFYNYKTEKSYPYSWGWYLSAEFQMYIVAMIYLLIYTKNKFVGVCLFIISIIGSMVINYSFSTENKFPMIYWQLEPNSHYNDVVYHIPWYKCGPFYIGSLFGIFYINSKTNKNSIPAKFSQKLSNNKSLCYLCYVIGSCIIIFYAILPYPEVTQTYYYSPIIRWIYQATIKTFTVSALVLIIIPGIMSNEKLIHFLLANKIAVVTGKLAFGVYLIHPIIIRCYLYSCTTNYHLSYLDILKHATYISAVTMLFAYLLYVLVERSFYRVEQKFISKPSNQHKYVITTSQI